MVSRLSIYYSQMLAVLHASNPLAINISYMRVIGYTTRKLVIDRKILSENFVIEILFHPSHLFIYIWLGRENQEKA